MHKSILLLTVFLLLFTGNIQGQNFKLGDVSVEELATTSDVIFPEAEAIVLSRRVENYLGKYIDVYERIKIYTKEGYGKATVYIPYVKVEKVKGATYNLVNGAVEKTKLDKDLIFEDEVIKGYAYKKFTFPRVTTGSIIEFSYRATRGTTSDISMQYDIPIRSLNIMVRNDTSTQFNILQNPRAFINVDRMDLNAKTTIAVNNVPPLIEENYVSDMNRYRAKLSISSQGSKYSFKTNVFGDFGQLLMNNDDFTRGFKVKKSFEPLVQEIIGDAKGEREKARLLYDYVHNEIEWDEYYGIFPDNSSSRETLKKKKGDLADINMLYIALLRAANIGAHPTLASTRKNGLPITPNFDTFNYLLVCANIEGERYLVDAAHTEATFDRLPKTIINYKALILKDDSAVDWEIIQEPKMSGEQIMVNLEMDEDLIIEGSAKERYTGYNAFNYSEFLEDLGDKRKEDVANYSMEGFDASDIEIKEDTIRNNVNISFDFEIEDAVEEIGDKLYFAPLFFLAMDENPFLSEERNFPIFFDYPNRQRYSITMKLPEGFLLEYLPSPVSLELPNGVGVFSYNITHNTTTNTLQLQTNMQINRSEVDAGSYMGIREFYKMIVEKETEKVVLKKA
jgi:hypothetical protein